MRSPRKSNPALALNLLGGFAATRAGIPVETFESHRVRALLAYLAVENDRSHTREFLAGLFWPNYPETRARQNLSQALYNLRAALGEREASRPYLIATKKSLRFDHISEHRLDVAEFEALLSRCEGHAHPDGDACERCLDLLDRAALLYRGEFLAGFSLSDDNLFSEWQIVTRERLHRRATAALDALIEHLEQRGDLERALEHAWSRVELEPLSESAQRQLIRLLALDGQSSQALAQFASFSRLLQDELGFEPNADTTALAEQVREKTLAPDQPAAPRHNLPTSLTPFIGRARELGKVTARLRDPQVRLLSLLGPGGSGKTRLALEAARALLEDFPDGIFLVPLGALNSPDGLLPAVAEALDLPHQEEDVPDAQLLDFLRRKYLLLVMDSSEHLLEGTPTMARLLEISPGSKILATSRVRLGLECEHIFRLSGLAVPEQEDCAAAAESEAVQLFLSGARRVQEGFALQEDSCRDVVRICRLVDGIPLGILLASAWVELLSPEDIADRIQKNFNFLTANWRDLPERQRSMRATLDYSWKLLSERERETLAALSVFRGDFSLPAGEQVVGCTINDLMDLVDKSMVQRMPRRRFYLHDVVRQYAADRLNRTPLFELEVRDQHSAYFLDLVVNAQAEMIGGGQKLALAALDKEKENLWSAWKWVVRAENTGLLAQAIDGLCLYFDLRGRYSEGARVCGAAAEMLEAAEPADQRLKARIKLLVWQSNFAGLQGQSDEMWALLRMAQDLIDQGEGHGLDLRWEQAFCWYRRGRAEQNLEAGQNNLQRGLAIYRTLDDSYWISRTLYHLGVVLHRSGDRSGSIRCFEEGVARLRELGEIQGLATVLRELGFAHAYVGHLDQALALIQEAVDLFHSSDDRYGKAFADHALGLIYVWLGRFAEACESLEEAQQFFRSTGNQLFLAINLVARSLAKVHLGDYPPAQIAALEALSLARDGDFQRELAVSHFSLGCIDLAKGSYNRAHKRYQESITIYRKMGLITELGMPLGGLGLAQRLLGDTDQARRRLCEALRLFKNTENYPHQVMNLPLAALLLADQGELERAFEIWITATRQPLVGQSRWATDVAGAQIQALAQQLPAQVRKAAKRTGEQHDLNDLLFDLLTIFNCDPH